MLEKDGVDDDGEDDDDDGDVDFVVCLSTFQEIRDEPKHVREYTYYKFCG